MSRYQSTVLPSANMSGEEYFLPDIAPHYKWILPH